MTEAELDDLERRAKDEGYASGDIEDFSRDVLALILEVRALRGVVRRIRNLLPVESEP